MCLKRKHTHPLPLTLTMFNTTTRLNLNNSKFSKGGGIVVSESVKDRVQGPQGSKR